MKKGIDVSVWQGSIDWSKAKNEIDFAILRAGYGKHFSQKDDRFEEYYAACEKHGIPKGAYWFSYATTADEAKLEANACIECLKGKKFEYPILFDIEHSSQTSKKVADAIIPAFCERLKEAGYYVGVYTYYSFITNYISESVYSKYDLALAHYASSTPWSNKQIWQYSCKGHISGINGEVDLDYCYVDDYPDKIKALGLNNLTASAPVVKKDDNVDYIVSTSKSVPANKVTTYSANDCTQISKHFNVQEFKCKCGKTHEILVNHNLVWYLEKIMDILDCSMTIINSGYRCPSYDKTFGFVGQHAAGNAVDAVFYDKDKNVISTKIISCIAQDLGGLGGIANITGSYTAIHLDVRQSNFWKGNEYVSNNTVTDNFYNYYGLTKDKVYPKTTTPVVEQVKPVEPENKPTSTSQFKAGDEIRLNGNYLFASAYATKSNGSKFGTFYVYDGEVVNGRIRITTDKSYAGKTPVGNYVTGWIIAPTTKKEETVSKTNTSSNTSTSLKAGTKLNLNSVPLYASGNAKSSSGRKTGTFYIYSDEVVNGRIRITNDTKNVGKTPAGKYVTGFVAVSDIK